MARKLLLAALACAFTLGLATTAQATVAYIDGNEVWVSTDDGSRKARLSGGEGDWREVAQSDQGYIVGTRRETGKLSTFTFFTIWNPSGTVVHFGSLSGDTGSNAYPLSFDITPSGGNLVYGFSHYVYGYPLGTLTEGIYLKVSADASTAVPLKITSAQYPTLVGSRMVGKLDDATVGVQDPSSIGSSTFNYWFDANIGGHELTRTDVAATGTMAASEYQTDAPQPIGDTVLMTKWGSFGTSSYVDDCLLPVQGNARNVTFSQDGSKMAWGDARGVVITGVPNMYSGGPSSCAMPGPPTVISASGSDPSIGPFNVDQLINTQIEANKPKITAPSSLKLKQLLAKGAQITLTSAVGGKASIKLTVTPKQVGKKGKKPIVIATGSTTLTANVAKKFKLKLSKAGKKLKKKLKGDKAVLTVTVGGSSTTKSVKLK